MSEWVRSYPGQNWELWVIWPDYIKVNGFYGTFHWKRYWVIPCKHIGLFPTFFIRNWRISWYDHCWIVMLCGIPAITVVINHIKRFFIMDEIMKHMDTWINITSYRTNMYSIAWNYLYTSIPKHCIRRHTLYPDISLHMCTHCTHILYLGKVVYLHFAINLYGLVTWGNSTVFEEFPQTKYTCTYKYSGYAPACCSCIFCKSFKCRCTPVSDSSGDIFMYIVFHFVFILHLFSLSLQKILSLANVCALQFWNKMLSLFSLNVCFVNCKILHF